MALCLCGVLTTFHLLPSLESPLAIASSNSTVIASQGQHGTGAELSSVRLQSFVNPHGTSFTATTVEEIPGLILVGQLGTVDATWFPGYAWQILVSPACGRHVGWRFTAISKADPESETAHLRAFDLLIWSELSACQESGAVIIDDDESADSLLAAATEAADTIGIAPQVLRVNSTGRRRFSS